jgi:hypothetical protein
MLSTVMDTPAKAVALLNLPWFAASCDGGCARKTQLKLLLEATNLL